MRIPDNQLRVRYPKNINSLYTQDFEKNRNRIGGKTAMFNRDKEKKFFKADPVPMVTTKQGDFKGEQVPYERVTRKRPASSYGPFIASTSYRSTFPGWDVTGGFVPTIVPKGNLQSSTNMPFKAKTAYRDTFKSAPASRPNSHLGGRAGGNNDSKNKGRKGRAGSTRKNINPADPNQVFGGKNRAQRSQISILSSPEKHTPFMNETTNRVEFRGKRPLDKTKPFKHPDNLGNLDLKIDPKLFNTSYRNNFNNFNKTGP